MSTINIEDAMPQGFSTYLNYWADYIEVSCLFNLDGTTSLEEISDAISSSRIGSNTPLEGTEEGLDNIRSKLLDCFEVLQGRLKTYGKYYPFTINNRNISKTSLNQEKKFYIALLLSSNLSIFKKKIHNWTKNFEKSSTSLLKEYLPKDAEIINFGSSGAAPKQLGSKNLKDKIEEISKKIRFDVAPDLVGMPSKRGGDFGIDLIGWRRFKKQDQTHGTTIGFAQCGCGRNWDKKQLSISETSLSRIFSFKHSTLAIMLTPQSLRNGDGYWEKPIEIQKVILLDRANFVLDIPKIEQKKIYSKYYKNVLEPLIKN